MEFHDHIWNHHEKCIQINTNMPGIGSLIREIAVLSKTNARVRGKCFVIGVIHFLNIPASCRKYSSNSTHWFLVFPYEERDIA